MKKHMPKTRYKVYLKTLEILKDYEYCQLRLGICSAITKAQQILELNVYCNPYFYYDLEEYYPELLKHYNGTINAYWWPLEDIDSRINIIQEILDTHKIEPLWKQWLRKLRILKTL